MDTHLMMSWMMRLGYRRGGSAPLHSPLFPPPIHLSGPPSLHPRPCCFSHPPLPLHVFSCSFLLPHPSFMLFPLLFLLLLLSFPSPLPPFLPFVLFFCSLILTSQPAPSPWQYRFSEDGDPTFNGKPNVFDPNFHLLVCMDFWNPNPPTHPLTGQLVNTSIY